MREPEMDIIGDWIHEALTHRDDKARLHQIQSRVAKLNRNFPLP
jgi:glycine/serine hydroxymethyltransferase